MHQNPFFVAEALESRRLLAGASVSPSLSWDTQPPPSVGSSGIYAITDGFVGQLYGSVYRSSANPVAPPYTLITGSVAVGWLGGQTIGNIQLDNSYLNGVIPPTPSAYLPPTSFTFSKSQLGPH